MTYVIWKFPILPTNNKVEMPEDAEVLTAQMQGSTLCIWALVDPSADKVKRDIVVVATGHEISKAEDLEDSARRHVGTVQVGDLALHVFDLGEE